jgi:hypothetical protein
MLGVWMKANVYYSGLPTPAAAREHFVREPDKVQLEARGRVLVVVLAAE